VLSQAEQALWQSGLQQPLQGNFAARSAFGFGNSWIERRRLLRRISWRSCEYFVPSLGDMEASVTAPKQFGGEI